ncbi:sulfatase [Halegenticoccus tardaugens]|uniref:sulfatase n=1 Tax=Halegenticoccus tardaugens TaxID=2071624 RepID=UPI00100A78B2|nr:sulfatase [Halegenticoccus tardaugens]
MKTLLITIDAWRASHASFAPDAAEAYTPALASFAEDGTVFTQAVSHGPATPYAFPALFSSTLPLDHGGYERISPDRTLVSERLQAAGWSCVGVHGNPWLGAKYGYGRGYDFYEDVGEFGLPLFDDTREFLIDRFGLDHPVYRAAQTLYRHAQTPLQRIRGGPDEIDVAVRALETGADDRFVWTHLLTPHAPYTPPKRHREAMGVPELSTSPTALVTRAQHDPGVLSSREREAVKRLYAASVRHADERLRPLLNAVDDETLVVVTADHGEALFEHGQLGHEPCLYDELIRVPLLIRPPADATVGARTVDRQVQHIDVAPTILDYAGLSPPGTFAGRSLRPAIEGDGLDDRLAISEVASTAATPGQINESAVQIGVRSPERKLLLDADGGRYGFDLRDDPGEERPSREPSGAEWRSFEAALDARLDAIDLSGAVAAERDADVERRLQDLGYLD